MKVIDLFAGAGGLSEGFKRNNYDIIAHVESDESASLTLKTREAYHYLKKQNKLYIYELYLKGKIDREEFYSYIPNNVLDRVIHEEIKDETIDCIFEKIDADEVDIIIGGPPCQAYSLAGRSRDKNGMKNDARNFLYFQYIKFLKKYNPKYFIFENVTGILSAQGGSIFEDIKLNMKLSGYNIDYKILNSKDFGAIQDRKRVILIGWRYDINFKYPEFTNIKPLGTINELFEDLPKIKSGEMLEVGEYEALPSKLLKKLKIRDEWNLLTQHTARKNNDRDLEIYRLCVEKWSNFNERLKYNQLPRRLITHNNTISFLDRYKVINGNGISHTVVAHLSKDGHHFIHPDINQNRSITVREAARIQTFPDDYYFETCRTDAFRQIGNAVPPLMAEEIAKKIKEYI